jgi:hypothetical protein
MLDKHGKIEQKMLVQQYLEQIRSNKNKNKNAYTAAGKKHHIALRFALVNILIS